MPEHKKSCLIKDSFFIHSEKQLLKAMVNFILHGRIRHINM